MHSDFQKAGRGQRGSKWASKPGQNLLFSIFLKPIFLDLRRQHLLTFAPAIAVFETLGRIAGDYTQIKIKWPNDVIINNKKVSGILTECSIQQGLLQSAIVGIGCNINQLDFGNLQATSLAAETGQSYSRFEILEEILLSLEKEYLHLKAGKEDRLLTNYQAAMWRRGELSWFKDASGNSFKGTIVGVTRQGKLAVQIRNELQTFNFKEIKYLP